MVVAEYPPPAGEGVLVQVAGLLVLAQPVHIGGEAAGRGEGVVVAEHPSAPGEGVLVQVAGLLVPAQGPQVEGEVVGRGEGVRVVIA